MASQGKKGLAHREGEGGELPSPEKYNERS